VVHYHQWGPGGGRRGHRRPRRLECHLVLTGQADLRRVRREAPLEAYREAHLEVQVTAPRQECTT